MAKDARVLSVCVHAMDVSNRQLQGLNHADSNFFPSPTASSHSEQANIPILCGPGYLASRNRSVATTAATTAATYVTGLLARRHVLANVDDTGI